MTHSNPDMDVALITWETPNGRGQRRLIALEFAMCQLGAGYARVQIIDPETDAILFEEVN